MHIATQVLTTQEVVCSRRHYLFFGVFLQRQVHCTLQAHRRIELLSQIEVHRQLDNWLYHLLQQDKAEITVHIPLTVHFATGNLLQDGILKALIQPHLISYMQVVNRWFFLRHQSFLELEIRTIIAMFAYPRAMPFIHPTLGIRSMHGVWVDSLQIETNIRRQARLVKKQVLNRNILLIRTSQKR